MITEVESIYTQTWRRNTHIPSREEFHRYASDILYESDFCTDYPGSYHISGTVHSYTIDKIASSIRWTKMNAKNKPYQIWPKRREEKC